MHLIQWVLVFFFPFSLHLNPNRFLSEISQGSFFSFLFSFLNTKKLYAFWKILSNALFHDSAVCNDIGAQSIGHGRFSKKIHLWKPKSIHFSSPNRFHSTWDRIQQTFWVFIKLFRWYRERQQNKVCIFYFDNCKWNSKKHFTVFWSFNLFYFRILDSVIMSAVIDPPPKVLPENVTLVFKNMQVYTLLFRYVYSFFNWIGVFLFVCFFLFVSWKGNTNSPFIPYLGDFAVIFSLSSN